MRTTSSAYCLFSGRYASIGDARESRRRYTRSQPDKPDVMEARIPERKSDRMEAIAKLKEDAKKAFLH